MTAPLIVADAVVDRLGHDRPATALGDRSRLQEVVLGGLAMGGDSPLEPMLLRADDFTERVPLDGFTYRVLALPQDVPEPTSIALLVMGLLVVACTTRSCLPRAGK